MQYLSLLQILITRLLCILALVVSQSILFLSRYVNLLILSLLLLLCRFWIPLLDQLSLFLLILPSKYLQLPLLILHNSPLLIGLLPLMPIDLTQLPLLFLQLLILLFQMLLPQLVLLNIT